MTKNFIKKVLKAYIEDGEESLPVYDSILAGRGWVSEGHVSLTVKEYYDVLNETDVEIKEMRKNFDLETEITKLMKQLAIPASLLGYGYIRKAVFLACENPLIINAITKELYPSIAEAYGTTPSRVERSIRHCIERTWSYGHQDKLEEVFGYIVLPEKGKPTNSEFIATLADHIRIKHKIK